MFESQSFFKSIQCPHFSTSNSSCERLYCPFRHSKEELNPTSSTATSSQINNETKLTKELPNALENLSNALQTIQDIFKQKKDEISSCSDQSDILTSTIVSQLNSLTDVINSNAPTDTKKLTGSALTAHLKKQQAAAPAYNPTPISELKKQRQKELIEKMPIKRKEENESSDVVKKLKTEPVNEVVKSTSTQETKKCDLISFSKLSLSQQVIKRYEMLNKEPPTAASINQAKSKKKLENSKVETKKPIDPNVPQLILDTTPSATMRVPLAIRQKFLKIIFDSCKLIYKPIDMACQKASQDEKSIYDRSKNKQIYSNLAAVLIKQLRSEQEKLNIETNNKKAGISSNAVSSASVQSKTSTKSEKTVYSHEEMLNGPKKVSYSINKNKQIEYKDLTVNQVYQMFYQYILTEKQLNDNSFPKWLDSQKEHGDRLAFIPNFNSAIKNPTEKKPLNDNPDSKLLTKTCKRCSGNFYLNQDMSYYNGNSECVYHWGKLRNVRVNKVIEQKYSCCSSGPNGLGCEDGKHVYDGDYDGHGRGTDLTGYVETQNPSTPLDMLHSKSSKNIFALDCEMCYTTRGLEVTRVSVVDLNLKTIYESLVKPEAEILDYNTRWSGLTEASLKNCTKNLQQVQIELLRLVNRDTILLGHSLDSDFKALKLIHKNVIDTSVVFPHKLGPPFKRALRNLMSEYLQRIIQEDAEGHDSLEDATSCVHLMIWKINEDLRSSKNPPDFLKPTQVVQAQTSYHVSNVVKSPGKLTQTDTILLNQVKAKIADGQYMKQSQKTYTQLSTMVNNNKTPPSVKINSNS